MGMGMGAMTGHRQTSSISSPGNFTSPIPQQQQNYFSGSTPMRPTSSFSPTPAAAAKPPAAAPAAKSANFDDLWSLSLGGGSSAGKPAAGPSKSIKDLEKEKATAGLWGQQKPVGGAPLPSFGVFGNGAPPSSSTGGNDDLLL